MLKNAYNRVHTIDGQLLQPDQPLSYPYFSIIKDRLYWVTQDAQTKEDATQLLVPKSRRESHFKSLIAPIAISEGSLRENWYGPHQAIGTFSTWPSFCIISRWLCNMISGSSTVAHHFGKESGRCNVCTDTDIVQTCIGITQKEWNITQI